MAAAIEPPPEEEPQGTPLEITAVPHWAGDGGAQHAANVWSEDADAAPEADDPLGFASVVDQPAFADAEIVPANGEPPVPAHRVLLARLPGLRAQLEGPPPVRIASEAPRAALTAALRALYSNSLAVETPPVAAAHTAALEATFGGPLEAAEPLAATLSAALRSGDFADTCIACDDDPSGVPLHRVVLAARAKHFAALFGSGLAEAQQERVLLPGEAAEVMAAIYEYLYTRSATQALHEDLIVPALVAADRLQIDDLLGIIVGKVELHLDNDNVCSMLALAKQLNCAPLLQCATSYAVTHMDAVEGSDYFDLLGPVEHVRLRQLAAALVNNPLGPGVVHDLREFVGMLKEARTTQRERLAEARELHDEQRELIRQETGRRLGDSPAPLFDPPATRGQLNANRRAEQWWRVEATLRAQADKVAALEQHVAAQERMVAVMADPGGGAAAGEEGAPVDAEQAQAILTEVLRTSGVEADGGGTAGR